MYPNDDKSRTDTGGELSRRDTKDVLHYGRTNHKSNERGQGMKGRVYTIGVVISFLALAGVAEAITGRGDYTISSILLAVGFVMCLTGYRHEQ